MSESFKPSSNQGFDEDWKASNVDSLQNEEAFSIHGVDEVVVPKNIETNATLPMMQGEELAKAITEAKDFDHLYTALNEAQSLVGSAQIYTAEELIRVIDKIRDAAKVITMDGKNLQAFSKDNAPMSGAGVLLKMLTREGGLREKVRQLIESGVV